MIHSDTHAAKLAEVDLQHLISFCKELRVKSLAIFGSAINGSFTKESDYDFLVDFNETNPFEYADLYYALYDRLEDYLDRKIDLIELRAIKNPVFLEQTNKTKVIIYES